MAPSTSSGIQDLDKLLNVNLRDTSQINVDPAIQQAVLGGAQNIGQLFQQRAGNALELQRIPEFSGTLSPLIQSLSAQAIGAQKQKQGAQTNALTQTLSRSGTGNNSALIAALSSQGQFRGQAANNAILPALLQGQRQQDVASQQRAIQANQQALQARQLGTSELGTGGQLLQGLAGFGAQTGQRVGTKTGSTKEESRAVAKTTKRSGLGALFG